MHNAALQRGDAFIEFLADSGARLDVKDKQGRLPLDLALGGGGRGQQAARESAAAILRKRMNLRNRRDVRLEPDASAAWSAWRPA